MSYDKELHSQEASLLQRAYDARCATDFLFTKCEAEKRKAEAYAEGTPERGKALARAATLTVAYKIAQAERDKLIDELSLALRAPYEIMGTETGRVPA